MIFPKHDLESVALNMTAKNKTKQHFCSAEQTCIHDQSLHAEPTNNISSPIIDYYKVINGQYDKRHFKSHKSMKFMKSFCEWLEKWKTGTAIKGLTCQTFGAATQTSHAYPLLVDYIFKNPDFDYVLTGNISSDFIEGRFGWYRQLCGANYYNSVLQMLQAEKRIRLRSLINMGFNLKNIHELFEDNDNGALLVNDVCKLVDSIPENCFEQLLADADQAIVYSLSGYAAKNII